MSSNLVQKRRNYCNILQDEGVRMADELSRPLSTVRQP